MKRASLFLILLAAGRGLAQAPPVQKKPLDRFESWL
jgi:hypothetical protein